MNFQDIFKSSFLEQTTALTPLDMGLAFLCAFAVGMLIMLIYKHTFKGVMYSKSFAISLLAIDLITTMIILTISSNIILSLGMVGALSIVRFRTAIKEPMDIAFMFWAISAGIVFGAGLFGLGLVGSVLIAGVMLLFAGKKNEAESYVLVVNCSDAAERNVMQMVANACKGFVLKAKTVSAEGNELTMQLRLPQGGSGFLGRMLAVPGVSNAVLVSYNGDYLD